MGTQALKSEHEYKKSESYFHADHIEGLLNVCFQQSDKIKLSHTVR